jgi:hypothetical protein
MSGLCDWFFVSTRVVVFAKTLGNDLLLVDGRTSCCVALRFLFSSSQLNV